MAFHVHRLDINRHAKFLAEGRQDPIAKEILKPGDEIVICANSNCNTAYYSDSWNSINIGKCSSCGGTNTLNYVPESVLKLIKSPVKLPHELPLEISESALSRFRWQFVPAVLITSISVGMLMGSTIVGLLFLLLGWLLSKPFFRYQCATGKNFIAPAWIVAGVILMVAIIPGASTRIPVQSSTPTLQTPLPQGGVKPPPKVSPPARKQQMAKVASKSVVMRSNHYSQAPSAGSLSQNERVAVLDQWNPGRPDAVVVTSRVTLVTTSGPIRLDEGTIVYILAEKETTYVVSYKRGNKEVIGEVPAEVVAEVGTETWYKVRTQAGKEGWVSSKFIELLQE